MFCPRCGEQYRAGFRRCAECGAALVEHRPHRTEPRRGGPAPVAVFETSNTGVLVVAKSLLEAEKISYLVQGEPLQDLFGAGRFGTGFSPIAGPMEIVVAAEDADSARDLLSGLEGGPRAREMKER
jgi:zinc-ribbon domain/Putative prokaryotic signal transducing protein